MASPTLAARMAGRHARLMAGAEREGLILAAKVRLGTLALIMATQTGTTHDHGAAYAYTVGVLLLFALLTGAHWWAAAKGPALRPLVYGLLALDVAGLALFFASGNPFQPFTHSPAEAFHHHEFYWFFIFLIQAAFSLSWRLVAWTGLCIALARTAQFVWAYGSPATVTEASLQGLSVQAQMAAAMRPDFLSPAQLVFDLVACLALAAGLAFVVRRSRDLVARAGVAERARASLSRYFSPNVVDELADKDEEVRRPRAQEVAVLFADIVGFTRLCETASAEEVVGLLREYHDRVGACVLAHGGTIDKYVGDGLMATFGTPRPSRRAAADALACVLAIAGTVAAWNEQRRGRGEPAVGVGVGAHHGPAVVGDIGNERRLEFAVIGDTINVASRIEGLTRFEGSSLLVSGDLVEAAKRAGAGAELLSKLRPIGERPLRGRGEAVGLWGLAEAARAASARDPGSMATAPPLA
jgi:adenylate cyclase